MRVPPTPKSKIGQTVAAQRSRLALWRARPGRRSLFSDAERKRAAINGRKVKFLTMDDAYSAPKCVEATRRLVEQDEVLALFGSLGTAPPDRRA